MRRCVFYCIAKNIQDNFLYMQHISNYVFMLYIMCPYRKFMPLSLYFILYKFHYTI